MSEVEINLAGRPVKLVCTLRAAKSISAMSGGIADVFRRLVAYDLDTYIAIVAAGANKKPVDIEDAVYETGMTTLIEPLSIYVGMIANGGRPAKSDEAEQAGEA